MSPPNDITSHDEQILDLLDASLPEHEQAELRAWLDQSPEHWGRFAELSYLHSQIASQLQNERSAEGVRLDALQAVPAEQPLPPIHLDAEALTKHKIIAALAYVTKRAVTPKRLAMVGSVAASLLLAATLFFVLRGDNAPESEFASPPSATNTTAQAVATLTNTHNATWAEGASAPGSLTPGSKLHPGTRLTLTAGYAEITTNDGEVVIFEAPATIELLDNDNAIRLHAGKLVGICETDSSKGFLVRTPHMDITDLGTRFGVDASQARATEVHVFEGEVAAARSEQSNNPLSLVAGQAAVAETGSATIASIPWDASSFARILPTRLPGTGVGLAVGDQDPNWWIVAIDGKPLKQPFAATVADPAGFEITVREDVRYLTNDAEASQWITWPKYRKVNRSLAYQTTFDAPGFAPDSLALELRLIADKRIKSIKLNGQSIDVSALRDTSPAYTEMQALTIDRGLVAGKNTLTIVTDRYFEPTGAAYWFGLRVELELTGQRLSAGPNE